MVTTLKLDDKGRGSVRKFGGRPGQKFTARTDGPNIVLEPVDAGEDSGDDWKPTMTVAELYRTTAGLPKGFGWRMPTENVRRVTHQTVG